MAQPPTVQEDDGKTIPADAEARDTTVYLDRVPREARAPLHNHRHRCTLMLATYSSVTGQ
jgi:hypothetical protein